MPRPAFLERLERPDFYAVAKHGSFVYCYLRPDGTPYYVGLASYGFRPVHPKSHVCGVPTDQRLIRVLRSGLTPEQAADWERRYISRWGRRRDGGILENRLAGGNMGSRRNLSSRLDALLVAIRGEGAI